METTEALAVIEAMLRRCIRHVYPNGLWIDAAGAPERTRLEAARDRDAEKRSGIVVSQDLLDYTFTDQLIRIVLENWEMFAPIFADQGRTGELFQIVADVRNAIAHGRDLVPFERDLISGIAGHLANQVGLYLGQARASQHYYPVMERLTDQYGQESFPRGVYPVNSTIEHPAVEVGDSVTLIGSAISARGREVTWYLRPNRTTPGPAILDGSDLLPIGHGETMRHVYTFEPDDVGGADLMVYLVSDSKYHRYKHFERGYDDSRMLCYQVFPPENE